MKLEFWKRAKTKYNPKDALQVVEVHLDEHFARYHFFNRGSGITVEGGRLYEHPLSESAPDRGPDVGEPFIYRGLWQARGIPIPTTYDGVFGRKYSDEREMFPQHTVNPTELHPDRVFTGNIRNLYEWAGQMFDDGSSDVHLRRSALNVLNTLINSTSEDTRSKLIDKYNAIAAELEALELTQQVGRIVEYQRPAELKASILERARKIFDLRPLQSQQEAKQFAHGMEYVFRPIKYSSEIPSEPLEREVFGLGSATANSVDVEGLPYIHVLSTTTFSILEACEASGKDPRVFGKSVLENLYTERRFLFNLQNSVDSLLEGDGFKLLEGSNIVRDLKARFKGVEYPLPTRYRVNEESEKYVSLLHGGWWRDDGYWGRLVERLQKLGLVEPNEVKS